jgi:hypothetical protein
MRNVGGFRRSACAVVWALATPVVALWPSDPATNLVIADGASEQVQPKLVATADGGVFLSWFDNSTGGYDVRLQRLDAKGDEQFAHNGVLVADRDFSSTQDYGLSIDAAGNALLAYRFEVAGVTQVYASKVSPTGALVWGAPGVPVSTGSDDANSPRITGTSDGHAVVAWSAGNEIRAQKLDANGAPLWGAGIAITPVSGSFLIADLKPGDAGTAIVSFVPNPNRHLWAQKLDSADGAPMWGASPLPVYDQAGGTLQFGNFPEFLPDGAGGAVFAWYTSSPALQVRVQRVLANGTELFAHNGIEASTDGTQLRSAPSAAFDGSSGDVFVFWRETNALQSLIGLYGQRFDATGTRQWGATGKVVVPLGSEDLSQIETDLIGGQPVVAWATEEAFDDQPIRAERFDADGNPVWSPAVVEIKSADSSTSRLTGVRSADGSLVFAWTDDATLRDLKAQNLHGNGELGTVIFADGFEAGNTAAWN